MARLTIPSPIIEWGILILGSHRGMMGDDLPVHGADSQEQAQWLYDSAPYAVLAHNTFKDPMFVYANRTAQTCFGYSLEEFCALPSRLSAEPINREERQSILECVARDGFVTGYRGVRISKQGRRFWIENGFIWQVRDEAGRLHGQAATFSAWKDIDP